MTWQDIDNIVRLFEKIEYEDNVNASDWYMDEDNTGISYDYLSRKDICLEVLRRLNITQNIEKNETDG